MNSKRGIQSLEVGFRLIHALERAGRRMPLKLLAEEAGMPASKAYLYLVSFQRLEMVAQDPRTGHYGLGPAALRLGAAAINQYDVANAAAVHIQSLQDSFPQAFTLSIWGNHGPTIIYKLDGRYRSPFSVKVGFVLPLMTTATGRMFMAHLPESQWRVLAEIEEQQRPGLLSDVSAGLEAIRESRLSMTESRLQSGFYGISAPIFGADGMIHAALTALGVSRFDNPIENVGLQAALTKATQEIGRMTGSPEKIPCSLPLSSADR
nr:IclR family transcriptional regulator [Halomonas socia]